MKKYLFANWKMYLGLNDSINLAKKYASNLEINDELSVVVFPSSLSFVKVKEELKDSKIKLGFQNAYWVPEGGYTGENSVKMYQESGCENALVGHSERRHKFAETNEDVRNKMESILENNLIPILCVGETKDERDNEETDNIVKEQLVSALKRLNFKDRELFVAYEPVWAIGTGESCSAVSAEHMSEKIKNWIDDLQIDAKPVILYGGSVNKDNVADYLKENNIDGVLVGGASVKFDSWENIIKAVI